MNSARPYDFDERVVVKDTDRTRANGTAGWHGKVVGKSHEGDDPSGRVLSYGVAMDEDGGVVWMVDPDDLDPGQGTNGLDE